MQWKEMDWPIMIDSLNLAGIEVVPKTYALDEHGIVRFIDPRPDDIEEFLGTIYRGPASPPGKPEKSRNLKQLRADTRRGTASAWRAYGDALFLWGGKERLTEVIESYTAALRIAPGDSVSHFRLGVAYRGRYDSDDRRAGDFTKAVEHWARALDLNPNQYIWRRRVQQYGPRLAKPYPFYDWVDEARREIRARGDSPVELPVEPGGAEVASPSRTFHATNPGIDEPDPEARVLRDDVVLIEVESTVVPPVIKPGESARVHVLFRPNRQVRAHWNNEVEGLSFWINPPQGWAVDRRHLSLPNPPIMISKETRELQFEIRAPVDARPTDYSLPAYALYYVCEDVNGTCLFRRRDITVVIPVRNQGQ